MLSMCNYKAMADVYEPPNPRFAADVLEKQSRSIEYARSAGIIQHGTDEFVMVVNEVRQIVYASPRLIEVFADGPFYGKRPGELLSCVHAEIDRCGFTNFCRYCGAAKAILDAQKSLSEVNGECIVRTKSAGLAETYNFKIRAIPIDIDADQFILILLDDLSAEKHKAALERIFFHDILNTATGLSAYLDLLKRQVTAEADRELVVRVNEIAANMVDEIRSQKLLVSAENGTLRLKRQIIVSDELIRVVVKQYEHLDVAEGKTLQTAPFSDSFTFVSDETILRRVLGNMVKNALEAIQPDETVTIRYGVKNNNAVFEVHNPGTIPDEAKSKIFARYFSTKGADRGLGTYSIKLLAEGYLGGHVSFSSEPDGTVFMVSIPIKGIS